MNESVKGWLIARLETHNSEKAKTNREHFKKAGLPLSDVASAAIDEMERTGGTIQDVVDELLLDRPKPRRPR